MSIWTLLGPPHLSTTTENFPSRPDRHFYDKSTVEKVTASKRFHISRLAHTLRIAQHRRKHRDVLEQTLHWANTVPILTTFPDAPVEEVTRLAIADRQDWMDPDRHLYDPYNPPEELLPLWTYTYLKHNRTNYNQLCTETTRVPFGRYAYPVILHRVNVLILDSYPLDVKVRGDTGSETRTCKYCSVQEKGHFNGHYWVKPHHWYSRAKNHRHNTVHDFCTLKCAGAYSQGRKHLRHPHL